MITLQLPSDTKTSRQECILRTPTSLAGLAVLDRRVSPTEARTALQIGADADTHKVIPIRLISPRDMLF
jgi:hypothetical protein